MRTYIEFLRQLTLFLPFLLSIPRGYFVGVAMILYICFVGFKTSSFNYSIAFITIFHCLLNSGHAGNSTVIKGLESLIFRSRYCNMMVRSDPCLTTSDGEDVLDIKEIQNVEVDKYKRSIGIKKTVRLEEENIQSQSHNYFDAMKILRTIKIIG